MKSIALVVCIIWGTMLKAHAQVDHVGAGRSLSFNGFSDYLEVQNSFPSLKFPFSVSAWIYLPPDFFGAGPIFVTNDNAPLYHGFWFTANASGILCEVGDGTGGNNPAFRQGKFAFVPNMLGRWIHVASVVRSPFDLDIYVNGVNAGGSTSGGSFLSTMDAPYPEDKAKIGYFLSNQVTYMYKGEIDEVCLWNRALSALEVRTYMCKKLSNTETGLIAHWDFDETSGSTVKDVTGNGSDALFVGNPVRHYSGAPIGDKSIFSYPAGSNLTMRDGADSVTIQQITGNPEGVQIYEVQATPSQTGGLNLANTNQPYFGVFLASLDVDNKFDIATCDAFHRTDNSIDTWTHQDNFFKKISQRTELVGQIQGSIVPVELDPLRVICNGASTVLSSAANDPSFSYHWNTGQSTPSIVVNQNGNYKLSVQETCGLFSDSIDVYFQKIPTVDLGQDEFTCTFIPRMLTPPQNNQDSYLWQNGAGSSFFQANDFGTYSVTISNFCGKASDTVHYVQIIDPVLNLDLGRDTLLCNQSSWTLKSHVSTSGSTLLWNTGESSENITVNQSGKYWIKVTQACTVTKDSVTLLMIDSPKPFSLGNNESTCIFKPRLLDPQIETNGLEWHWQDGSSGPTFQVDQFGKYWLSVSNECGQATDSVEFKFTKLIVKNVPDVITPNEDDYNRVFEIQDDLVGNTALVIVDRWGKEVFRSDTYKNNWDAHDLTGGVYFVLLKGHCIDEWKGTLTIIK